MSAEHAHEVPENLTKNQALVFHALDGAEKPLGAYDLLDELRGEGIRSPLQIYRALDKLIGRGLVHRLESLNAFILCAHCGVAGHKSAAFTICDLCGQVSEVEDEDLVERLAQLTSATGFRLEKSTIELRGICANCQAA